MNHLLLLLGLLLLSTPSVNAQFSAGASMMATGLVMGDHDAGRPQAPIEYVMRRAYQGPWYACKRTPVDQLPRKGCR